MNKQVQISYQLLMDLCRYHLMGDDDPALEARIRKGLEDKMQRAAAREEYSRNIKKDTY